jgi:single-stranded-DNA-specific exonuclease
MKYAWEIMEGAPAEVLTAFPEEERDVAQILWHRGVRTEPEARAFLNPDWDLHTHSPFLFRHIDRALERVFQALGAGERITVHGDYDADGVTGTTVVMTTLREISKKLGGDSSLIDYYIPHRDKEGYGLQMDTVPKLAERGTKVIITVDCGISCVPEIKAAKEAGIDTIVLDHHEFGEELPDGFLIHPGLPDEPYPWNSLAAVGVAFKFASALIEEARKRGLDFIEGHEKWLLDLVAIATITDIVPLRGENRVLETYGLKVLNKTRRPGLQALFERAGITQGTISVRDIGFGIGPRINAAGRMDHAERALKLLLSESMDEAKMLADDLERLNRERQIASKKMMLEADALIESRDISPDHPAMVLWQSDWSPALVGLVAGKFAERHWRPTLVVGMHGSQWIGSGRSVPGFNVSEAVKKSGEGILTRAGGHNQACGFALRDGERLPEFQERFCEYVRANMDKEASRPRLKIDFVCPLSSVTLKTIESVSRLEPFGEGNPEPIFLSRGCSVATADQIGASRQHLRMQLVDESGKRVKAIGFGVGERLKEVKTGDTIDLVYSMSLNDWNGRQNAECRILDFKTSGAE